MGRKNRTKRFPQKSKRELSRKMIFSQYKHDDNLVIKRVQNQYVAHREMLKKSKSTRSELYELVGENVIINGTIIDITYTPEKALFLKQITLGSVTVHHPKTGEKYEVDHINASIEITDADKISDILKITNRIQIESTVKYYNKKKDPLKHTRLFKKEKTDISLNIIKTATKIKHLDDSKPLTLFVRNRFEPWFTNRNDIKILEEYLKHLPNRGYREDFIQSINYTKSGYKYINYRKIGRYLYKYPHKRFEQLFESTYNYTVNREPREQYKRHKHQNR